MQFWDKTVFFNDLAIDAIPFLSTADGHWSCSRTILPTLVDADVDVDGGNV